MATQKKHPAAIQCLVFPYSADLLAHEPLIHTWIHHVPIILRGLWPTNCLPRHRRSKSSDLDASSHPIASVVGMVATEEMVNKLNSVPFVWSPLLGQAMQRRLEIISIFCEK